MTVPNLNSMTAGYSSEGGSSVIWSNAVFGLDYRYAEQLARAVQLAHGRISPDSPYTSTSAYGTSAVAWVKEISLSALRTKRLNECRIAEKDRLPRRGEALSKKSPGNMTGRRSRSESHDLSQE